MIDIRAYDGPAPRKTGRSEPCLHVRHIAEAARTLKTIEKVTVMKPRHLLLIALLLTAFWLRIHRLDDFPTGIYGHASYGDQPFYLIHRVMTTNTAAGLRPRRMRAAR